MQFKFLVTVTITEAGLAEIQKQKLSNETVQSEILDALKKELEPQSDEQAALAVTAVENMS